MADRERIIEAMLAPCAAQSTLERLSKEAVEETGLGRVDDKIVKNRLVATKTPGTEILTPWVRTGDDGLVLQEYAPFGVIAAITRTQPDRDHLVQHQLHRCGELGGVQCAPGDSAALRSDLSPTSVCPAAVHGGGARNLLTCIEEPTIEPPTS